MGDLHRARYVGEVGGISMLSPSQSASQHINVFNNMEALQIPSFRGFYGGFIMKICLIKSLAIFIEVDLQPLSPGMGSRGRELDGLKSPTLQGWLGSFW